MELESSLSSIQEPVTGSYPETAESTAQSLHTIPLISI